MKTIRWQRGTARPLRAGKGSAGPWAGAAFLAAITVATSIGCGSSPPKLVPAEGVILIDGEPAADISVQFLPDEVEGEKRPTSYAVTDSEGRFVLKTYEQGNGAVVGGHSVILVDTLEERPEQGQELTAPPRLDSRYSTITGGVRATVTDGGGPITVDVSSSGPADAEREQR